MVIGGVFVAEVIGPRGTRVYHTLSLRWSQNQSVRKFSLLFISSRWFWKIHSLSERNQQRIAERFIFWWIDNRDLIWPAEVFFSIRSFLCIIWFTVSLWLFESFSDCWYLFSLRCFFRSYDRPWCLRYTLVRSVMNDFVLSSSFASLSSLRVLSVLTVTVAEKWSWPPDMLLIDGRRLCAWVCIVYTTYYIRNPRCIIYSKV